MKSVLSILFCFSILVAPLGVSAFETDQYNLPPVPLADIGDEVSEYVEENLLAAIRNVNREIAICQACIDANSKPSKGCGTAGDELRKLAYLRSNDALADELAGLLAGGRLMTTRFGKWIHAHKFRGQPDRFKTSYSQSIFVLNPADYWTLSPTVRLYGVELGIDKLEHFFQQGHQYYKIAQKAVTNGSPLESAEKNAVEWGQKTERTYYGLLSSGVYSNADLVANYAGMRFYEGLSKTISIGNQGRVPLAVIERGLWKRSPQYSIKNVLKPFISDHMNEAMNPSSFRLTLVRSVRRAVKKHDCPDWLRAFPDLTASDFDNRSKALETWNGEDYGFTDRSRTVEIGETCFEERP